MPTGFTAKLRLSEKIIQLVINYRLSFLHQAGECISSLSADKLVRILALGYNQHLCLCSYLPQYTQCPHCGFLSRRVTVIAEINLRCIAHQQTALLSGECRPQGCSDILNPSRRQGYGIHIPFHHDYLFRCADCLCRPVKAEEHTALIKQRGFGRVQILRLTAVHDTASEGYNSSSFIGNRYHHPIAEAIVYTAPLTFFHQSGFQKKLLADAAPTEGGVKFIKRIRGKTQRKLSNNILSDTSGCPVISSCGSHFRLCQTVVKVVAGKLQYLPKLIVVFVTLPLLRRFFLLRQRHSQPVSLKLQRLKEGNILYQRNEFKNIAPGVTAEAVKQPFVTIHGE